MLSHEMVASVMAAFNQEFDVWAADTQSPDTVDFWLKRLRQAGMTHENAQDLVAGFCDAWPARKATLHDICMWIRERLRAAGPAGLDKGEREARLAFVAGAEFGAMLERMKAKLRGGS